MPGSRSHPFGVLRPPRRCRRRAEVRPVLHRVHEAPVADVVEAQARVDAVVADTLYRRRGRVTAVHQSQYRDVPVGRGVVLVHGQVVARPPKSFTGLWPLADEVAGKNRGGRGPFASLESLPQLANRMGRRDLRRRCHLFTLTVWLTVRTRRRLTGKARMATA